MEKQYWLADGKKVDKYGTVWNPELLDGPHSDPKDVKGAMKIIQGIGLDRGKIRNYCMVTIENVPDVEVEVNEEAIAINKKAMDFATNKNS